MKFSKSRQRRGGQPFDDKDVDYGFNMGYPTNNYQPDSRYFPSPATAELEKSDPLPEDKIPGYNNPGSRVRSRSRSRSRSRALSRTRSRSGGNRRKKRRKTKTKRIRRNSRR